MFAPVWPSFQLLKQVTAPSQILVGPLCRWTPEHHSHLLQSNNLTDVYSYSPGLVLCDFFLFRRIKSQLWGCYLCDVPEIQLQLLNVLQAISKESVPTASSSRRIAGPVAQPRQRNSLKGPKTTNKEGAAIFLYWFSRKTFGYTRVLRLHYFFVRHQLKTHQLCEVLRLCVSNSTYFLICAYTATYQQSKRKQRQ